MKEPTRLIHGGSPRAKALLASLDEDVPPDPVGGEERLLRALDLGPESAVLPRERPHATRRAAMVALVSTGGLLVLSAMVFGVSHRDERAGSTEAPATVTSPTVEARVEVPSAPVDEPNVASLPSVDVHTLASAAPDDRADPSVAPRGITRRGAREAAPASTARPSEATDVAEELALLERAQQAASQGRADEALSLVERHRREFPRGRFGVEMSVVEIEALARKGRIEDAAARGERFLERHPGSPYTRRVEAIVRSKNQKEETR